MDQVTPDMKFYYKVHAVETLIPFKVWMILFSLAHRYFVFPLCVWGRVRGSFPEFLQVKKK